MERERKREREGGDKEKGEIKRRGRERRGILKTLKLNIEHIQPHTTTRHLLDSFVALLYALFPWEIKHKKEYIKQHKLDPFIVWFQGTLLLKKN